jgi:hypothetical protein
MILRRTLRLILNFVQHQAIERKALKARDLALGNVLQRSDLGTQARRHQPILGKVRQVRKGPNVFVCAQL